MFLSAPSALPTDNNMKPTRNFDRSIPINGALKLDDFSKAFIANQLLLSKH